MQIMETVILGVYLVAMTLIGIYFTRRHILLKAIIGQREKVLIHSLEHLLYLRLWRVLAR
ncbi:hypothetical protein [Lentibacillus sp.]|uniref:hypothetical protein n=1 Tax=Lentibacillus sp. TaxID=1925746 RepID=UPI002B4B4FE1|nr:hypothetical protein [Lentibacillus sp.]HLS08369.1 hypothetical protein [Lentibacillus sp.]